EVGRLGAGVVLTGGGASLPGTIEVAQHVFGAPARIGVAGTEMGGLADGIRKPRFATAAGLVLFAALQKIEAGGGSGFGDTAVGRLVAWLKEFFQVPEPAVHNLAGVRSAVYAGHPEAGAAMMIFQIADAAAQSARQNDVGVR